MRLKKFPSVALVVTLMVSLLAAPPATAQVSPEGTTSETATLPSEPAKKAAKGKITGKVTFRGKPAKGVRVVAAKAGREYRTKTNAKGRFSLKAPRGKYKVSALSGKYDAHRTYAGGALRHPEAKTIRVRPGKTVKARVRLAPAATVTGRVVDIDGRPVAGAFVDTSVFKDRYGKWQDVSTDSKGRYTLKRLPHGKIELAADNRPHAGETHLVGQVVVRAKAGKKVTAPDIVVNRVPYGVITAEVEWPEGVEQGSVVALDKANGRSTVLTQDPATTLWSAEVTTGSWLVTAAGSNVVTGTVTVTDGATVHAGTVVVPEARGTLKGTVLTKNGKPATSGQVLIQDALGEYSDHGYLAKNGTFTVEGLAPGTHTLYFQSPGDTEKKWGLQSLPQRVEVAAGETTAATIKLERGRTVRGKVLHRGKGVAGIGVELWRTPQLTRHYTTTNAKGVFKFTLVPRDKYVLEVKEQTPVYRIKRKSLTVDGNVKGLRIKIKK